MKLQILLEDNKPSWLTESDMEKLLSHSTTRLIWGEGNPYAPLFVVLDNPGAREDKEGKKYLCVTRETLLKGFLEVGIGIEQVYVSYSLKSRPLRKYNKEMARTISLKYLRKQIELHKPKVVLCLGDVVVKSYFQDLQISVKQLRGKPHVMNNITTVVSYHPLAVRRRPNLLGIFQEDLSIVSLLLASANH